MHQLMQAPTDKHSSETRSSSSATLSSSSATLSSLFGARPHSCSRLLPLVCSLSRACTLSRSLPPSLLVLLAPPSLVRALTHTLAVCFFLAISLCRYMRDDAVSCFHHAVSCFLSLAPSLLLSFFLALSFPQPVFLSFSPSILFSLPRSLFLCLCLSP